jgi:hypothetical protein
MLWGWTRCDAAAEGGDHDAGTALRRSPPVGEYWSNGEEKAAKAAPTPRSVPGWSDLLLLRWSPRW